MTPKMCGLARPPPLDPLSPSGCARHRLHRRVLRLPNGRIGNPTDQPFLGGTELAAATVGLIKLVTGRAVTYRRRSSRSCPTSPAPRERGPRGSPRSHEPGGLLIRPRQWPRRTRSWAFRHAPCFRVPALDETVSKAMELLSSLRVRLRLWFAMHTEQPALRRAGVHLLR